MHRQKSEEMRKILKIQAMPLHQSISRGISIIKNRKDGTDRDKLKYDTVFCHIVPPNYVGLNLSHPHS